MLQIGGFVDSFNPDCMDIFEENDVEIYSDENNNQDDSYVSEEDEDFILDESEFDVESDYNSSEVCMSSEEDDTHMDKNGKRGKCGANGDEDDENKDDDDNEEFAIWTSYSF